ncbi:MAG: hypothetical protein AAF621_06085 [Pseudomonadota bacterium]
MGIGTNYTTKNYNPNAKAGRPCLLPEVRGQTISPKRVSFADKCPDTEKPLTETLDIPHSYIFKDIPITCAEEMLQAASLLIYMLSQPQLRKLGKKCGSKIVDLDKTCDELNKALEVIAKADRAIKDILVPRYYERVDKKEFDKGLVAFLKRIEKINDTISDITGEKTISDITGEKTISDITGEKTIITQDIRKKFPTLNKEEQEELRIGLETVCGEHEVYNKNYLYTEYLEKLFGNICDLAINRFKKRSYRKALLDFPIIIIRADENNAPVVEEISRNREEASQKLNDLCDHIYIRHCAYKEPSPIQLEEIKKHEKTIDELRQKVDELIQKCARQTSDLMRFLQGHPNIDQTLLKDLSPVVKIIELLERINNDAFIAQPKPLVKTQEECFSEPSQSKNLAEEIAEAKPAATDCKASEALEVDTLKEEYKSVSDKTEKTHSDALLQLRRAMEKFCPHMQAEIPNSM